MNLEPGRYYKAVTGEKLRFVGLVGVDYEFEVVHPSTFRDTGYRLKGPYGKLDGFVKASGLTEVVPPKGLGHA